MFHSNTKRFKTVSVGLNNL